MKSLLAISLILLTTASCTATRPPINEDSIDAGAVQRIGWRPSGPPNKPVSWEDSIDAGSVQQSARHPSSPPNAPVTWEDSIDAGRVNPAWRHPSTTTDQLAAPATSVGQSCTGPVVGGS